MKKVLNQADQKFEKYNFMPGKTINVIDEVFKND